jgi:hypothetical protein
MTERPKLFFNRASGVLEYEAIRRERVHINAQQSDRIA